MLIHSNSIPLQSHITLMYKIYICIMNKKQKYKQFNETWVIQTSMFTSSTACPEHATMYIFQQNYTQTCHQLQILSYPEITIGYTYFHDQSLPSKNDLI